jgi:sulfate permease, SulP family
MKNRASPQQFSPSQIISSIIGGVIIGAIQVTFSLSLALLIFSGNLSPYLSSGIAIALFSGFLVMTGMTFFSSFSGVVAGIQESPAVIIAIVVSQIALEMSPNSTNQEIYPTVMFIIALSTVVTGLTCWTLGKLKLGNLSRFLPYPIIGGFLAGTGWLLLTGSVQIMTDIPLTISSLSSLFEGNILPHWLSGMSLAIVLLIASRRYLHWSVIPLILLITVTIIYFLLWITHTSISQAIAMKWLLTIPSQTSLWQTLNPPELMKVNWLVIFNHLDSVFMIILITVVNLLLNLSSLEQSLRQELNLNRELQTTGLIMIASGFAGSMIGYHSLSSSVLADKLNTRNRLGGLITAIILLITLIGGTSIVSFFPRPLLGGLLMFLGLSFLVEWLYDNYFQLPIKDYFLLVLIWLIIITFGFLEGMAIGLLMAMILFIFRYSLVDVVHQIKLSHSQSHVARPVWQSQILQKKLGQIRIFQLQGFIFFGSSYHLINDLTRDSEDQQKTLDIMILECHLVSGLDASAIFTFTKLYKKLSDQCITLIFCSLSPSLEQILQQKLSCHQELSPTNCYFFRDFDLALEWCEEQLIQEDHEQTLQFLQRSPSLSEQLTLWLSPEEIAELISYMEIQKFPSDHILFRQGDLPTGLYFLISGQISVVIEDSNRQSKLLRTFSESIILGEISFYEQTPHSVSVLVNQPSIFYYLSSERFLKIQQEKPQWTVALEHLIIVQLSDQLKHRDQQWLNQLSR